MIKRILSLTALLAFVLALALAAGCGGGKTEEAADDTAQHKCSKCDMQMADKDMVEKDGVWYCSHCAPADDAHDHEGHDHDHDHDDHDGHDHG